MCLCGLVPVTRFQCNISLGTLKRDLVLNAASNVERWGEKSGDQKPTKKSLIIGNGQIGLSYFTKTLFLALFGIPIQNFLINVPNIYDKLQTC